MPDLLLPLIPLVLSLVAVIALLWLAHVLLIKRHSDLGGERMFSRQLIMLGLTLTGILVIILATPIDKDARNQLLGLFGIIVSGLIAFSSTTIIANLMAGLLLRITKPFRVGDFIRIGGHTGRVSERGLFDTEIQTETRELIAFPNSYCISNPITTIRSSGTIISANLSLGYDVPHEQIENLLLEAAEKSGLTDPFVHIIELGNFAVSYRVSGFLEDTRRLITMQSNLYAAVLDTLHRQRIEIMSPNYMYQKQLAKEDLTIPAVSRKLNQTADNAIPDSKTSAEKIAFDKADQAEQLDQQRRMLKKQIERLENAAKINSDIEEKTRLLETSERLKHAIKALEKPPSGTD